jgi:CDP-6-deoxy-D-xylo-4-hexulose-3-dehydrase
LQEYFILPQATPNSEPSWFGFPLAVRADAPFTRNQLIQFLDSRKIATRLLFGGNLVRQPAYRNSQFRIASPLDNTDFIMNQVFWLGVYPGLTRPMLDYICDTLFAFKKQLH